MVRFVFTTQTNRNTRYQGPSGRGYVICQGFSFDVTDQKDIVHFDNNSRFKRVLLKKVAAPIIPEKIEADWLKELEDIWGISKSLATKIFELYPIKDKLVEALEMRYNLGTEITKKKQVILRKQFLGA